MHFQVYNEDSPDATEYGANYTWVLIKADGSGVCASLGSFVSEKEARSDIANAKKSMKGAGRCKVLSPGETL